MAAKKRTQFEEPDPFEIPSPRKPGRPATKEYDVDYIEELARDGCTVYEIAAICGLSESYFHVLKKNDIKIQEAIDRGKANLHKSIRKKQVELAMEGSVPLLIHLGKTELGQTDRLEINQNVKAEVEYEIKFGEPIEANQEDDQAAETTQSSA